MGGFKSEMLATNEKNVAEYRAGKANPAQVNELLKAKLAD